jgi:hypothetical protein
MSRPTEIARQYDDNAGNLTFRMNRVPDVTYTVFGDYQRKPPILTGPASPWGPVPDQFAYIYHQGFLALMMVLINDSRFPIFEQYFTARLLGAQDGLSDQERNIFLGDWTRVMQTVARSQGSVNAGIAGRSK